MPSTRPSQKSAVSPPIFIIPELEHIKRAALSTLASVNTRRMGRNPASMKMFAVR